MNRLGSMFSALRLDADHDGEEDGGVEVQQPSSSTDDSATSKPDKNGQNDIVSVNYDEGMLLKSSIDYKMPLVWIDLEMTGLDITRDRILEIACIITDGKLTKQIEGPDLVIRQSKECLDNMGEWCKTHHAASGLTERVLQSELSELDAEAQVMNFVRRHVGSATPLLAGNSVYVDLQFLKLRKGANLYIIMEVVYLTSGLLNQNYMPQLAAIFSHVIVDVSSIMALCIRWYPKERKQTPRKQNTHRAMDDIRESIAELKYYKDNIFKPQKFKR